MPNPLGSLRFLGFERHPSTCENFKLSDLQGEHALVCLAGNTCIHSPPPLVTEPCTPPSPHHGPFFPLSALLSAQTLLLPSHSLGYVHVPLFWLQDQPVASVCVLLPKAQVTLCSLILWPTHCGQPERFPTHPKSALAHGSNRGRKDHHGR